MTTRQRCTLVLGMLVCAGLLLPGQARAGAIRGKVVLAGPVPAASKLSVTIDQYVCGTEKPAEDLVVSPQREIRNAVVWIQNAPARAAWSQPAGPSQVDQKECVFVPRVMIVPAGGTVEFLNSDRLLHNLHASPRDNAPFNRTQPKGRTIPVVFPKPEIIRVDCDLHSWMRTWVVVAEHPYYAITSATGAFAFENLPPGQYTLLIWQEKLGITSRDVTVTGDGATAVSVELRAK